MWNPALKGGNHIVQRSGPQRGNNADAARQRAVERHHAQRRTQDRQWAALASEMTALFEAAHRPFAETRSRAKESVQ